MKRSELALGLLVSTVMHGVVMLAMWQFMEAERAGAAGRGRSVVESVSNGEANPSGTGRFRAAAAAVSAGSDASPYDAPLAWLRPVFDRNAFGPPIDVRSGRVLRVDRNTAPDLKTPRFRPYSPPAIDAPRTDPGHDVLNRTRPVTYTRAALEREEAAFGKAIAADLHDCRLDEIPLDEVILRSRYLRLQKLLFDKGLEPDFSYTEVRGHFMAKLQRIRRSLEGVRPERLFDELLFQYRKDKFYEEKRGHSLFNAIFYDIYNCRTGTEELAMYLSLFHPDLPLGFNRGSIIKFDGTLIGHVDPAVRINGRWTVFQTVSQEARAVIPYEIGELFPIEKLVLDYVPGFDGAACRLNRPLVRNGEELDDALNARSDKLHPLIVKHDDSRIILLRETAPLPETFPMIRREDRLFSEMMGRYRTVSDSGPEPLLHEDYPYLDFIYHLQSAPAGDRKDLVSLYLKNRVDAAPTVPKRPLRIPGHLPAYQDLVRTLFSDPLPPELEILPGMVVPTATYLPHKAYIEDHNRAVDALAAKTRDPQHQGLPPAVARFLLFFNGRGTVLVQPPLDDPGQLVRDLINDRFDLSPFMNRELQRRKNGTSGRRIAILKAGVAGGDAMARSALEDRLGKLRAVLDQKPVVFKDLEAREAGEIPGAVSYGETIRHQGKTGLSPGFVKDMVELMGETEAVSVFARYLERPQTGISRVAMLEMLGYMDRYLLLETSRQRLVALARDRFADAGNGPVQTAAAQFLVRKGAVSADAANDVYLAYLGAAPADALTVGSLLAAGLDREKAAARFRREIHGIDLNMASAHQRLDALDRIARVMDDLEGRRRIIEKHEMFLGAFFHRASNDSHATAPDLAGALNTLSYLARQAGQGDERIFPRLVNLGANHPEALVLGELVGKWMGSKRYRAALASALNHETERFSAAIQDLVRLRADLNGFEVAGGLPAYASALAGVRDSAARMSFLAALNFQNGFRNRAVTSQEGLIGRLFALEEFSKDFETIHGAAFALERSRVLNHEAIHRVVELAGFLSKEMKRPGALDLNHAPFIKLSGDYRAACGPTRRTINSRSAPNTIAFTSAGTYFTSLLDPGNSPAQVAAAFEKEQALLRTLTATPLKPDRADQMAQTLAFFRDMDRSDPCDIRRVYVFEKLLRHSALPENLPGWIRSMAEDSHRFERAFLERMEKAGGPAAVLDDHRRMAKDAFERKWGESPFSIRNLYGTLLLVKTGDLEVDASGVFRPTAKLRPPVSPMTRTPADAS